MALPLQATEQMAELAQEMKGLRAFVHVSTAFANVHMPAGTCVEERMYTLHTRKGDFVNHKALAARLAAAPPRKAKRKVRPVSSQ